MQPDQGNHEIPQYMAAAQRLSDLLNIPESDLVSDSYKPISPYPTPACLSPEEVADYQNHIPIGANRLMHVESCASCASLLEAAAPNRLLLRAFLDEVERIPDTNEAEEKTAPARLSWNARFLLPLVSAAGLALCAMNLLTLNRVDQLAQVSWIEKLPRPKRVSRLHLRLSR